MHYILLSGGSGKRLWPLSNDIRSKQFIKLFKKDEQDFESMVQRVYRQITDTDLSAKITIATSKSQVSAIRNQLSDNVDICVEPCRRDTFPAIALAVAYLIDKKGIDKNQSIVVCPVDPFVENTYYQSVGELISASEHDNVNLYLMGIQPTYPSEKYGYIIPDKNDQISRVSEFKEKPDYETAKKYISMGALWNAGVFAFKLGYIYDITHSLFDFTDYDDLLVKYEVLPKISFDYAVVEKEKDINVLRYSGEWKDVGTWNMMSEVMKSNVKGNAVLDDTCENTHVVNELGLPILCMGCKNMVIAASNDGILVSDKERSGYMKPYVDTITNDAMYAEKSWGTYTVIDVQKCSMTIKISLCAENSMKYHSHELRDEVWTIISGTGVVTIDGVQNHVKSGDVITIPRETKHSILAQTNLNLIEIQIGESISRKDKIIHTI